MKRRETWLGLILISLAYGGVLLVGSEWYRKERSKHEAEQERLELEWIVIETLLEDQDKWNIRANWLNANQPPYGPSEKIDRELYEKASAEGIEGVVTSRLNLLPPVETPNYLQAGVFVQAKGELRPVMNWVHDLTRPEDFQVVRNFRLEQDTENPGIVSAQFELLKRHSPLPSTEATVQP